MHAIVVDPSRVVLKLISGMIAERGDRVTECHDSAAALRSIKNDPSIDVLITSLEVEPIGGLELCWEARLTIPAQRALYIIVMSSLSDDEKLAEALDCGADDLIAKPVKRLELHARLRMAGRMKTAQMHLVKLAETDPLTGLFNRRAFFERLNAYLGNMKEGGSLTTVLFDIDHFKSVNDTYGHDVGDIVIRRVAEEANKHDGIVGRLGGEEFAIILPNCDNAKGFQLAETLRRNCANLSFSAAGHPFTVTCSFGIGRWVAGDGADDVLKKADVALYHAKEGGRNRVHSVEAMTSLPPGHRPTVARGRPRQSE